MATIYQVCELYQSILKNSPNINFGHHDLHQNNLVYTVHNGQFKIKIIDFGFSCHQDEMFTKKSFEAHCTGNASENDICVAEQEMFTPEEHATMDVLQLMMSFYVSCSENIRNYLGYLVGCNDCKCCLYSCKYLEKRAIHEDFYLFGKRKYTAKYCELHKNIDFLDTIKENIKEDLSNNGIKFEEDEITS